MACLRSTNWNSKCSEVGLVFRPAERVNDIERYCQVEVSSSKRAAR